jgi:flagellar biosynthesis GTPase FlhF
MRVQVAAEAIKQAEREGRHVVLVDTAGRMQVGRKSRSTDASACCCHVLESLCPLKQCSL